MLLGVIADDFTGASDVANTLAREGMRARLFVGADGDMGGCEAGVVALKSRSVPAAEAVALSLDALTRLRAAGARQILFKYCSTFDSTPAGNIGPVAEALAEALGATGVVVCPAFPGAGRTVYQGHLFVGDRLLSESGMERHPLTPMTDPDLRRWLARQTRRAPGHVPLSVVRDGRTAIRAALAAADATLVVVDAAADEDLRAIGAAADGAALLTGGSGIALGLPANFRRAGLLSGSAGGFVPNGEPAVILSGSCSAATRGQVEAHAVGHPSFEIDVPALIAGRDVLAEALACLAEHRDALPLIFSSADPERVAAVQAAHGREASAAAVEHLFGALARACVTAGFGRIVAAGGETSGAVVEALRLGALDIGPEIAPGVPAMSAQGPDGRRLALALKSGNFGGPAFMARAAAMLGGASG